MITAALASIAICLSPFVMVYFLRVATKKRLDRIAGERFDVDRQ